MFTNITNLPREARDGQTVSRKPPQECTSRKPSTTGDMLCIKATYLESNLESDLDLYHVQRPIYKTQT